MKTLLENVALVSADRILENRSILFGEKIEKILYLEEGKKVKENE